MSSFTKVLVHLVWATVGRSRLITPAVRELLLPYVYRKATECSSVVLAAEAMPDHVHIAVRIHNGVAISELVQKLKGASAHYLNHRGYGRHVSGGPVLRWRRGYGAFSFWERDSRIVVGYVNSQHERHLRDRWLPFDALVQGPSDLVSAAAHAIEHEAILIHEWEEDGEDSAEAQPEGLSVRRTSQRRL